jgi:methylated-DNA-[protein]-cysteine S-methyltransferase
MKKSQCLFNSPVGRLYLVASEKGLQGIFWKKQPAPMAKTLKEAGAEIKILARAARELGAYFGGQLKKFEVPLDLSGTPFQKKVWSALARIPYSETRSYRDVAAKIGNAKAVRAVGSANGKNPVCIIVPCHRVISSDGSLGGYSGGLHVKTKLLELERKPVSDFGFNIKNPKVLLAGKRRGAH